ncbi:MAG: alanine--tRNA ligase [Myxococcota bacterium]
MRVDDIRHRFLSYFADRGHDTVPSASLVPHDDPTLFFVNAGMVPFKDVFTGAETREVNRATSVQRCVRVSGKHNDLENVGRTPRHHTFFEMLGNFSFGDYFKEEAIGFAWDFLTRELSVDADRLWVTIFEDDDEAYDLWRAAGFPDSRLQRLGAKDNYWSMGDTGPCGPCSEIHYDHGPSISSETGGPATEDPRYVEIWNLVFMQFDQRANGEKLALPRPSIDTGMGLERIAAVAQGKYSNYETDAFAGLLEQAALSAGKAYGSGGEEDVAMRVIADHARATAFLVSDGVMPSNEARGYVLRRIMRRAIRFGVKLGIEKNFFHDVVQRVIRDFGAAYPELQERTHFIDEIVRSEEDRFRSTLDRGLKLLDREMARVGAGGTLPGDVAFTLSDTYGFPLDLTQLIAEERGVAVDEVAYKTELEAQRARGRKAWKGSGEEAVGELWRDVGTQHGQTEFDGYPSQQSNGTQGQGRIVSLARKADGDLELVQRLEAGESGIVVLDKTPFYAESGGQVGDAGRLADGNTAFRVDDTQKGSGLHLHHGVVESGALTVDMGVQATVDPTVRDQTRRNHTATHLLHAALRSVLGDHVTQKGSLVGPDRLRFDFSHHKPVSAEQLRQIEDLVNDEVLKNTELSSTVMALDEAKAAGAMALFGEKYADDVRVVSVPGFSVELCGGTHVHRTGDIGSLIITGETGIAAGVRRIEAQTGTGALQVARDWSGTVQAAASALKTGSDQLLDAIRKLQDDRKRVEKELAALQSKLASEAAGALIDGAQDHGGVKVLAARYDGDLKEQADRLRDQLGTALIVLAQQKGPKAVLLVAATADLAGKRVHAGKLVKELAAHVGGGGGGRPDLAQAGGARPEGIDAALAAAYEWAAQNLV